VSWGYTLLEFFKKGKKTPVGKKKGKHGGTSHIFQCPKCWVLKNLADPYGYTCQVRVITVA
jgi:hypothetical protein